MTKSTRMKWTQEQVDEHQAKIAKGAHYMPKQTKNVPRHKYNAQPQVHDGIRFDSKKEAARYEELKLLVKAGEVVMFLRQTPFDLPGGVKYRSDFLIFWADGNVTTEDVKGFKTPEYKAKKKMVEALYPIKIVER